MHAVLIGRNDFYKALECVCNILQREIKNKIKLKAYPIILTKIIKILSI